MPIKNISLITERTLFFLMIILDLSYKLKCGFGNLLFPFDALSTTFLRLFIDFESGIIR